MTTMPPPEVPAPSLDTERRRLYRVGFLKLVLAGYALDAAVMLGFAGLGSVPWWVGPAWLAAGIGWWALFGMLFRTGAAEARGDPDLVAIQMTCHALTAAAFMQAAPRLTVIFVSALLVTASWGAMRLRPRQAVVAGAAVLALLAVALYPVAGSPWMPTGGLAARVLVWAAYATLFARLVPLGMYGAALSTQLAGRRRQISDLTADLEAARKALAAEREANHRRHGREDRGASLPDATSVAPDSAVPALLARLAHELRSPMTGVIGMQAMLEHSPLTEEQRGFLELAQRSARAVLPIVERAMAASLPAPDPKAPPPATDAVDVRDLFEDCLVDHGAAALDRRLLLELEVRPPDPPLIRIEQRRLRQALGALLDTAIEVTARGTLHLAAHCPDDGNPGELRLELRGSGLADAFPNGVPEAHVGESARAGFAACSRWVGELGGRVTVGRDAPSAPVSLHLPATAVSMQRTRSVAAAQAA